MTVIYSPTGKPTTKAQGLSADMRAEFQAIADALSAWYIEGTWTPSDLSGAGLSFTTAGTRYTKTGNLITLAASVTWPATADTSAAVIGGIPYAGAAAVFGGICVGYTNLGFMATLLIGGGGIALYNPSSGVALTNAQVSGKGFIFSGSYFFA
jgi:hypothetical protein